MFRHKGKRRTFIHNLRLASILSFIAGIVNISGVLALQTLTTNVTGHFGYFAEELFKENFSVAFAYLFFILSFLLGAFVSNMLIETVSRIKPRISHTLPMFIEVTLLVVVGLISYKSEFFYNYSQLIACSLLFAMGIQNSLVTQVSQATVRTTHLTGLFTDLGIELSQLFFYRKSFELKKLSRSIYLRFTIIAFFFFGCILGGFLFKLYELRSLLFAAFCLLVALYYDVIRYYYYLFKRSLKNK